MATEVVHDLGLDRETHSGMYHSGAPVTMQQLDRMRSYLGCFYLASALVTRPPFCFPLSPLEIPILSLT
jgi:hypothetical protein